MIFREYPPHKDLKPYIKCYWTLKYDASPVSADGGQQFLADGVEVMFNLGDPMAVVENDTGSSAIIDIGFSGPMSQPMIMKSSGIIDLFGVCFRAGGAYPFFSLPANELANRCADLETLWGSGGRRALDRIQDDRSSTPQRIRYLDAFFMHKLEQNRNDDVAVTKALHALEVNQGRVSIEDLATSTRLSCRQLERKFKERVGISPKKLCRNLRFKNVFKYLTDFTAENWSSVAVACGYYDQAHMIRDFKHFTGFPPTVYFDRQLGMEKFFTANF
jgi:AraC-like DNA-binding protein